MCESEHPWMTLRGPTLLDHLRPLPRCATTVSVIDMHADMSLAWPAALAAVASAAVGAADSSCTFNTTLDGVECSGLQAYTSAASADACEAACCAAGARCTTWQFCGDFTTYCGAEHGGCYIGAISAAGCHWQKGGCDAEACWVRGQGEMNVAGC